MKPEKQSNRGKNHKKPTQDRASKTPASDPSDFHLPADQELVMLPLRLLNAHPLQDVFNPPCSAQENAELAADLKANGMRDAIQVMPPHNKTGLPAHTMLDGHRRCAALIAIGKKEAKVIIRHDLRDADAATVELHFLKFNHNRRHYDLLAFANNLVRQYEIAEDRQRGHITGGAFEKVVKMFSICQRMCIRNAQRYIHLACTPAAIQNAHRQGHLKLEPAARVDGLEQDVQAIIAQRIANETDTGNIPLIVEEYFSPRHSFRPKFQTPIALGLIQKMKQDLANFPYDYNKLHGPTLKPFLPDLNEIKKVIDELILATERPGGSLDDILKTLVPLAEGLKKTS